MHNIIIIIITQLYKCRNPLTTAIAIEDGCPVLRRLVGGAAEIDQSSAAL